MTPIETLKHEHQVILLVLTAAEKEVQFIRAFNKVNGERVAKMLDFIRNFADKCHHAKEEDILFIKMEERGMPKESGPLAVMLHEHTLGRQKVAATAEALPKAEAGDAKAIAAVADNLEFYLNLLRSHIQKEDNILYPMAERIISADEFAQMMVAFDKVEAEEMGEGTHERFHQLAHELAK